MLFRSALSLSGFIIGVRRPKGNGESVRSAQPLVRICTADGGDRARGAACGETHNAQKKTEKPVQGFPVLIVFDDSVCSEFQVEKEHGFVFRPVPVPDFQDRDPGFGILRAGRHPADDPVLVFAVVAGLPLGGDVLGVLFHPVFPVELDVSFLCDLFSFCAGHADPSGSFGEWDYMLSRGRNQWEVL